MKSLLSFIVAISFSMSAIANPLSEQLNSKNASERAEIFTGLMKQNSKPCGEVNKSLLQGYNIHDDAYWSIACNSGSSYSVLISKEPSIPPVIVSCSSASLEVKCFETFEE